MSRTGPRCGRYAWCVVDHAAGPVHRSAAELVETFPRVGGAPVRVFLAADDDTVLVMVGRWALRPGAALRLARLVREAAERAVDGGQPAP